MQTVQTPHALRPPFAARSRLIVNPAAGADTAADQVPAIRERLEPHMGPIGVVVTGGDGDAHEAARRAVQEGVDHLFVAGGDGTLNEAVNGVASIEGGLAQITFGVIPLGTGNDFAAALALPDALDAVLDALVARRAVAVDVGELNGRCFVNVSAGGLKTMAGKLAYLIGGAQALLDFEPIRAQVHLPAGAGDATTAHLAGTDLLLHTFAVCNAPLIGGGRPIAPLARFDDGAFDVCLIRAMSSVEFVALLRHVATGAHLEDERVTYFRTPALEIAFDRSIRVNVDGQVLTTDRCQYTIRPGAARFLRGPD
jgi:diacylglycerol kinase (ATP)